MVGEMSTQARPRECYSVAEEYHDVVHYKSLEGPRLEYRKSEHSRKILTKGIRLIPARMFCRGNVA